MDIHALSSFVPGFRHPRLARAAIVALFVLEFVWWYSIGIIVADFIQTYRIIRACEQMRREQERVFWERYRRTHPGVYRRLRQRIFPIKSNHTRP